MSAPKIPPHRSVVVALTEKQAQTLLDHLDCHLVVSYPSKARASLATTRDHLRAAIKGQA